MRSYYVPYSGQSPAPIYVNGHKLIILYSDRPSTDLDLKQIGADHLEAFQVGGSAEEQNLAMANFAHKISAGIILASEDIKLDDVINNLKVKLPWLH